LLNLVGFSFQHVLYKSLCPGKVNAVSRLHKHYDHWSFLSPAATLAQNFIVYVP